MESNVQKMRDALEKLDKLLFVGVDGYVHGQPDKTDEIERTIKSALALSPRNCDVGTAEEQQKRFDMFTEKHWHMGKTDLQWAQMPYEEGGKE